MLPPRDLKMVVLVCKCWREIGEDPSLWTRCMVTLASRGDLEKLDIRRLQQIQVINVRARCFQADELEEMFQTVVTNPPLMPRLPKLREISGLANANISNVEPRLLARVVCRLEEVDMRKTNITSEQVRTLFTILCHWSQLKSLNLSVNNLSTVDPAVLSTAVNRLEKLDLNMTKMTSEQVQVLFTTMCQESQLKKLVISNNNLSTVEPEVLATAVNKLEEVGMWKTHITSEQAQTLFAAIAEGSSLKKLRIGINNLSSIEPAVLIRAVRRLEEVGLYGTQITNEQAETVFAAIAEESPLKKLILGFDNLTTIEPAVLATAVCRLEEVKMINANITSEQAITMFTAICQGSQLKRLHITNSNLSTIEQGVLATAVNRMEEVTMKNTQLSTQHVSCILTQCVEDDTKLKKLVLRGIDMTGVDQDIIRQVKEKLGMFFSF